MLNRSDGSNKERARERERERVLREGEDFISHTHAYKHCETFLLLKRGNFREVWMQTKRKREREREKKIARERKN